MIAAQAAISIKNSRYVLEVKEKAAIEKQMEAARAVQTSLLVPGEQFSGGKIHHFYHPADHTGGDWYGNYWDGRRNRLYMLLGDVTGHGISSALVTAAAAGAAASAIYGIGTANQNLEQDLRSIARAINQAVLRTGAPTNRVMTMALLAIDLENGRGHYLNAAHPAVLIARNRGNMDFLLKAGNHFGISENPHFGSLEFALEPGDRVFMHTDGLIENRDARGATLRQVTMRKLILGNPDPEQLLKQMTLLIDNFVKNEQTDDTAIIVFHWTFAMSQNQNARIRAV